MKSVCNHKVIKGKACNHRWQNANNLLSSSLLTQKYYVVYGFQTGNLTVVTGGRIFAYKTNNFDEIIGAYYRVPIISPVIPGILNTTTLNARLMKRFQKYLAF